MLTCAFSFSAVGDHDLELVLKKFIWDAFKIIKITYIYLFIYILCCPGEV